MHLFVQLNAGAGDKAAVGGDAHAAANVCAKLKCGIFLHVLTVFRVADIAVVSERSFHGDMCCIGLRGSRQRLTRENEDTMLPVHA